MPIQLEHVDHESQAAQQAPARGRPGWCPIATLRQKTRCLGLVRQCQQLLQRRQPPAAERRGSCRGASMRPTSSCKPAQEHFRGTMRLVKMPGDGNCLFHALAHPTGENGLRLREEMAQFLETAASEQGDYEDDWRAESEYLREDPTHWEGTPSSSPTRCCAGNASRCTGPPPTDTSTRMTGRTCR